MPDINHLNDNEPPNFLRTTTFIFCFTSLKAFHHTLPILGATLEDWSSSFSSPTSSSNSHSLQYLLSRTSHHLATLTAFSTPLSVDLFPSTQSTKYLQK